MLRSSFLLVPSLGNGAFPSSRLCHPAWGNDWILSGGQGHVLARILISSSSSLSLFFPPRCKKFVVLLCQGGNIDFRSYQHLMFASKRLLTVHSNSTEVANQNRYWLSKAKVKETLREGSDAGVNPKWLCSPKGICQWQVWLGLDCPRAPSALDGWRRSRAEDGWGCAPSLFPALKCSKGHGRRRVKIFRGDSCLVVKL